MKINLWDGEPISKPGWYSGVPIERYHSAGMCDGPAVSSSDLRTCFHKSPAHMFCRWAENPNAVEREMTRSMVLGSAAHHLLLGEERYDLRFVSQPDSYPDKKTGELKPWTYQANFCKDWRTKQETAGRIIVTRKELDAVVEISNSLKLEPLITAGLLSGDIECSGFFKDRQTGIWLKVRPDVVPMGAEFIDLKTTAEVTTPALMSSIRSYGYNQQGALIGEVCEGLGQPFESFMLMFAETAAPFCTRAVPMPEEDLGLGREQNRFMLTKIKACMDVGHWPGPGEGDLQPLGLSKDERERIRARLKLEAE